MKKFMIGLGIVIFIVAVFTGLISGGLSGILTGILSGVISSSIFFGIAAILDGQESILSELYILNSHKKSAYNTECANVTCKKCSKQYDSDYTSCPYCGNRP